MKRKYLKFNCQNIFKPKLLIKKPKTVLFCFLSFFLTGILSGQEKLIINDPGYFESSGFDVMVFDDYYPMGHQSGVTMADNSYFHINK